MGIDVCAAELMQNMTINAATTAKVFSNEFISWVSDVQKLPTKSKEHKTLHEIIDNLLFCHAAYREALRAGVFHMPPEHSAILVKVYVLAIQGRELLKIVAGFSMICKPVASVGPCFWEIKPARIVHP